MSTLRLSRHAASALLICLTFSNCTAPGDAPAPHSAATGAPVPQNKMAPAHPKPAAALTAEGTFTGIEQGDYMHWRMRTKTGEATWFILDPGDSVEKVLQNPAAYIGRQCRITWKKSTENIPEAGGNMEVEQILSVEWTGKP